MNEPKQRDPRSNTLVLLAGVVAIALLVFTDRWTTRDDLVAVTADVVSMQHRGTVTDCRTGKRLRNPDLTRTRNVVLKLEFTDARGVRHSTSYSKGLFDPLTKRHCRPGSTLDIRYDPTDTSVVFPPAAASRNTALIAACAGIAALVGIVVTLVRKPTP